MLCEIAMVMVLSCAPLDPKPNMDAVVEVIGIEMTVQEVLSGRYLAELRNLPEPPVVEPAPEPAPDPPAGIVLEGDARRIADCESGVRLADGTAAPGSYGTYPYNTSGPGMTPISTASGLFHFLDSTWQWVNAEIGGEQYARAVYAPAHVQLTAFNWLYDDGRGARHWLASASCHGIR